MKIQVLLLLICTSNQLFCLDLYAQSLIEDCKYAQALERLELTLKENPSFSLKYQLGCVYEKLNRWSEALYWYLEAFQDNPKDTSSLLAITAYYRHQGANDVAHIFAKYGHTLSPEEFEREMSIVAYYTPFQQEGYLAAGNLLTRKNQPPLSLLNAYRNFLFYVKQIPKTKTQRLNIQIPDSPDQKLEVYYPMNSSILRKPSGYQMICRAVNYTQQGAKEFRSTDPFGYFKSRNFLIELGPDFQVLSQTEILDFTKESWPIPCNVLGLEDPRMFCWNEEIWFTCTTYENAPFGVPRMALCQLNKEGHIQQKIFLEGPHPYRCEKNWLPFVSENELKVMYSYDPFQIYRVNLANGECQPIFSYDPEKSFKEFRGSAGPLSFDGGYLVLVHETVIKPDSSRVYLHRFLYLDQDFFIQKISFPFIFFHLGVEYCAGMCLDHEKKHAILSIGLEDREAHICQVDLDVVRSLLFWDEQ